MTKKEVKKTKLVKNNKNELFDKNGKLIARKKIPEDQIDEAVEQAENTINEARIRLGKEPLPTEEEIKEKKRAYWRKYYSCNKEKYKIWNRNWRQNQKKEKRST